MKMKGIWKRLATLTIMAALVLCLLPMGASAEDHGHDYNSTATNDGLKHYHSCTILDCTAKYEEKNYTVNGGTITEKCTFNGCNRTLTVTLSEIPDPEGNRFTYTGSAITPLANSVVEYCIDDNTIFFDGIPESDLVPVQYENNTNAGTATASITYGDATATQTFTINKAIPTAEHFTFIPPENLTYDGAPKAAEIVLASPYTDAGTITYKYYDADGNLLSGAPTNAGTYTVKIDVAEGGQNFNAASGLTSNGWTFIINPRSMEDATVVVSDSATYDGGAHIPTITVSNGLTAGTDYTITWDDASFVNAGTYTATITATATNSNYEGSTTATYTIAPAPLTVTPDADQTLTYGDTPNLTYTYTGAVNGETPAFIGALGLSNTDVGTQTITKGTLALTDGEGFKASNYTLVVADNVTATVNKATPTKEHFDITLPQNAVYDNTAKAATVALKDGYIGTGNVTIEYYEGETKLDSAPINAGTYTVKFSVAEGDNFYAMNLTEAGSFEIAKADPIKTAPVAIENLVYTGSPQRLTTIGYTANSAHKVLYWFNIGDVYSEQVLTATNAGAYTVKWYAHIGDDPNYGNKQGEIAVTIAPATITVTPKANQSITYGNEINLTYDPIDQKGTEIPRFTGKLTIDGTKAGTYKIKKGTLALADDESTGFKASNYTLVVDETVDFVIKPRALTLTVEDQTITYGESIDQAEYTVEGLADGDKATVKLTPSTENITKSGKITAKVSIKNAANEDVTDCYTNTEMTATLTINPDLSAIKDLTVDNVHHSNEEDIKAVQDMLDKAEADVKNDQNITEAQQKCANLLVQIHKSLDALRTDAIEDTLGTTASNVKLADKATINEAIGDIEEAKTDYAGNYNTADKAALNAQIANLEAALDAIEKAETVIDLMNGLPADVEPDDEKAIEAKAEYDKLTSNEKNMVASATATKLAALSTYKIVKGDKATWEKGKTLTFTINGDINRFTGVKVNGSTVNAKYYTAKKGSTIVTLEKSFFEQKSISSKAAHTITFMFNDGSVMGTFNIHKDAMTPATGDSSGIVLWTVILFASTAALAAVIVISRKRKNA